MNALDVTNVCAVGRSKGHRAGRWELGAGTAFPLGYGRDAPSLAQGAWPKYTALWTFRCLTLDISLMEK